jgi:hypothetical protein
MDENKVFRGLDAIRQMKTGEESITPGRALVIAREIVTHGLGRYIRLKSQNNPNFVGTPPDFQITTPKEWADYELGVERARIGQLSQKELFGILEGYMKREEKTGVEPIITPTIIAAAEECIRRFQSPPTPPSRSSNR